MKDSDKKEMERVVTEAKAFVEARNQEGLDALVKEWCGYMIWESEVGSQTLAGEDVFPALVYSILVGYQDRLRAGLVEETAPTEWVHEVWKEESPVQPG